MSGPITECHVKESHYFPNRSFRELLFLGPTSSRCRKNEEIDHSKISVFFGSTHIPKGAQDGSGVTLIIPNIGVNYEYWFTEHFALGSYNNIAAVDYHIDSDNYEDIHKVYPVILSAVAIFRPWKNLNLFIGPGVEIDKNNVVFVGRLGVDYSIRVGRSGWFFSPRVIYDNLGTDYSAWTFGLDIG